MSNSKFMTKQCIIYISPATLRTVYMKISLQILVSVDSTLFQLHICRLKMKLFSQGFHDIKMWGDCENYKNCGMKVENTNIYNCQCAGQLSYIYIWKFQKELEGIKEQPRFLSFHIESQSFHLSPLNRLSIPDSCARRYLSSKVVLYSA